MPTSDPIKRRFQNRDNQKKFRERQNKQLTELRATHDAQEERLKQLEATVEVLKKQNTEAELCNKSLRFTNTELEARLHSITSLASRVAERSKTDGDELLALLSTQDLISSAECRDISSSHTTELVNTEFEQTSNTSALEAFIDSDLVVEHEWPELGSGILTEWCDSGERLENDTVEDFTPQAHGSVVVPPLDESERDLILSSTAQSCSTMALVMTGVALPSILPNGHNVLLADLDLGSPISSFSYCSGQEPYISHALMNYDLSSRISKHIHAANSIIHQTISGVQLVSSMVQYGITERAIAWMAQKAWPKSVNCLKLMSVYQHWFDFELWRNFPCKATYYNIHPQYRPSPLQLLVPHHPAIDWLPWPKLREKAIELQDNIDVDLLHMTALQHTVIERDCVLEATEQHLSFRAWDIYQIEKAAGIIFPTTQMAYKPTSSFALAIINKYGLPYADISRLRLEPAFFNVFPQLWIPELVSNCFTSSLPHPELDLVEYPLELDTESIRLLRSEVNEALAVLI